MLRRVLQIKEDALSLEYKKEQRSLIWFSPFEVVECREVY